MIPFVTPEFPESREKNSKIISYFIRRLLILFVSLKNNNIFMRLCLCIFESNTVKSDCPMQENYKIFKDLIQTVGLLYYF